MALALVAMPGHRQLPPTPHHRPSPAAHTRFYRKKNEIKTPLDRLVYNLAYYKAKARMSIRFAYLVNPFLSYV